MVDALIVNTRRRGPGQMLGLDGSTSVGGGAGPGIAVPNLLKLIAAGLFLWYGSTRKATWAQATGALMGTEAVIEEIMRRMSVRHVSLRMATAPAAAPSGTVETPPSSASSTLNGMW